MPKNCMARVNEALIASVEKGNIRFECLSIALTVASAGPGRSTPDVVTQLFTGGLHIAHDNPFTLPVEAGSLDPRDLLLVQPIAFALFSTYLPITSPKFTSRRRFSLDRQVFESTGFGKILLVLLDPSRDGRVKREGAILPPHGFSGPPNGDLGEPGAEPSLRLMTVPIRLQHEAGFTILIVLKMGANHHTLNRNELEI